MGDPEAIEEADGEPLGHSAGNQLIARRDEQNHGARGDSFCMNLDQHAVDGKFITDVLRLLPVQPDHISNAQGPWMEVSKVDDGCVDVKVVAAFRAHFPRADDQLSPALHLGDQQLIVAPVGDQHRVVDVAVRSPLPGQGATLHDVQGRTARQLSAAGSLMLQAPRASGLKHAPEAGSSGRRIEHPVAHRTFRHAWEIDPQKVDLGPRIAVGGFAEVFVGKYEGTAVAIKRLLDSDAATIEQFKKEVALLARIRHPNLILFMGYCMTPDLCIVSEFMQRGCLYSILRRQPDVPLNPKLQKIVSISVARGMAYLHGLSPPILHLDIKSPNILVDSKWRVKVADFGLSRMRFRSFVTAGGSGGGTPHWMAPEMLQNEHIDEKADIYSYGVILWEILTGKVPWEGMNPMQVVAAVGFKKRSLPVPATGDPCLIRLFQRCCAWEPSDRPTFHEILEELEHHYSKEITTAAPETSTLLAPELNPNVQPIVDEPSTPTRGGEGLGTESMDCVGAHKCRPVADSTMEQMAGRLSFLQEEVEYAETPCKRNKTSEECSSHSLVKVDQEAVAVGGGGAAGPLAAEIHHPPAVAIEEDCMKDGIAEQEGGATPWIRPGSVPQPFSPFAAVSNTPFDMLSDKDVAAYGGAAIGSNTAATNPAVDFGSGCKQVEQGNGREVAGVGAESVVQVASAFASMANTPFAATSLKQVHLLRSPAGAVAMPVQDSFRDISSQVVHIPPSPFATCCDLVEISPSEQKIKTEESDFRRQLHTDDSMMGYDGVVLKVEGSRSDHGSTKCLATAVVGDAAGSGEEPSEEKNKCDICDVAVGGLDGYHSPSAPGSVDVDAALIDQDPPLSSPAKGQEKVLSFAEEVSNKVKLPYPGPSRECNPVCVASAGDSGNTAEGDAPATMGDDTHGVASALATSAPGGISSDDQSSAMQMIPARTAQSALPNVTNTAATLPDANPLASGHRPTPFGAWAHIPFDENSPPSHEMGDASALAKAPAVRAGCGLTEPSPWESVQSLGVRAQAINVTQMAGMLSVTKIEAWPGCCSHEPREDHTASPHANLNSLATGPIDCSQLGCCLSELECSMCSDLQVTHRSGKEACVWDSPGLEPLLACGQPAWAQVTGLKDKGDTDSQSVCSSVAATVLSPPAEAFGQGAHDAIPTSQMGSLPGSAVEDIAGMDAGNDWTIGVARSSDESSEYGSGFESDGADDVMDLHDLEWLVGGECGFAGPSQTSGPQLDMGREMGSGGGRGKGPVLGRIAQFRLEDRRVVECRGRGCCVSRINT